MKTENYRNVFKVEHVMKAIVSMKTRSDKKIMVQTERSYISAVRHVGKFFTRFPSFDYYCSHERVSKLYVDLEDFLHSKKKKVQIEKWERNQKDAARIPKQDAVNIYLE